MKEKATKLTNTDIIDDCIITFVIEHSKESCAALSHTETENTD